MPYFEVHELFNLCVMSLDVLMISPQAQGELGIFLGIDILEPFVSSFRPLEI